MTGSDSYDHLLISIAFRRYLLKLGPNILIFRDFKFFYITIVRPELCIATFSIEIIDFVFNPVNVRSFNFGMQLKCLFMLLICEYIIAYQ